MRRGLPPIAALILVLLAHPAFAAPGALDRTFSRNGMQTVFTSGAIAHGVAIDAQDRIVVAGYTIGRTDVAVARLKPGGALDGSFSGDGRVRIDLGATDRALDVAVTKDGKIVIVGERVTSRASTWFVIRLRSGGTRDTSFGGDGVVMTDFGRQFEHANAVTIQSNGKVVVAGGVGDGLNQSWAFARYLSGGALDSSFGGDGRVTMSLSISGEQAQDVIARSQGIFAAGYAEASFLPRFAVAKLRLDGHRATAFGTRGVKTINVGAGGDAAFGLAIQGDGKPVVAGYASMGGRADWGLARLGTGGVLDGGFGGDGLVTTAFTPSYELAEAVAIQGDGRIVVAGRARGPSGTEDLAVVRYHTDGGLNLAFSGNGKALFNPFGEDDEAYDVVVHEGKIVVVGDAMHNLVPRMIVLRLLVT